MHHERHRCLRRHRGQSRSLQTGQGGWGDKSILSPQFWTSAESTFNHFSTREVFWSSHFLFLILVLYGHDTVVILIEYANSTNYMEIQWFLSRCNTNMIQMWYRCDTHAIHKFWYTHDTHMIQTRYTRDTQHFFVTNMIRQCYRHDTDMIHSNVVFLIYSICTDFIEIVCKYLCFRYSSDTEEIQKPVKNHDFLWWFHWFCSTNDSESRAQIEQHEPTGGDFKNMLWSILFALWYWSG